MSRDVVLKTDHNPYSPSSHATWGGGSRRKEGKECIYRSFLFLIIVCCLICNKSISESVLSITVLLSFLPVFILTNMLLLAFSSPVLLRTGIDRGAWLVPSQGQSTTPPVLTSTILKIPSPAHWSSRLHHSMDGFVCLQELRLHTLGTLSSACPLERKKKNPPKQ